MLRKIFIYNNQNYSIKSCTQVCSYECSGNTFIPYQFHFPISLTKKSYFSSEKFIKADNFDHQGLALSLAAVLVKRMNLKIKQTLNYGCSKKIPGEKRKSAQKLEKRMAFRPVFASLKIFRQKHRTKWTI